MTLKRRKKPNRLFNPDVIMTTMHRFLDRDLHTLNQEYESSEHPSKVFRDIWIRDFDKKYSSPFTDPKTLEDKTYEKFLQVNEHMKDFRELNLPDPSTRVSSKLDARSRILLRARALMHSVLTDFELEELYTSTRNGRGSSIGVPFRDTSTERKFTFPISCTSRVKPLFMDYLSYDASLRHSIELFNKTTPLGEGINEVSGSRATTVEKNTSIRRMIAIEPTANMFFQQGLMSMMYDRMKRVGLDLELLPDHHKQLAMESSITRKNATIDFSSASDCVSIELLRWLLPPKWFWYCDMMRSTKMVVKDQVVDLNMFSTMGNAVTFPLETLVFWTIANACNTSSYIGNSLFPEWKRKMSVSVFGDDCIVPTEHASMFMETCQSVGFIVNDDKSYYKDEPFRESCGGDYLRGVNVRPFCWKAPASRKVSALEPWLYTLMNSILPLYISYFGSTNYVYDSHVFTYAFSLFRHYNLMVKVVPDDFPEDAGLKIGRDIQRFAACYDINFSPIHLSHQGTYRFNYCRYSYPDSKRVNDDIRYYSELKKLASKERPRPLFRRIRRGGGYIVAKAISAHWTLPRLN